MNTQPMKLSRNRYGFTLMEVVISIAVLSVILGAVGLFQVRGQKASQVVQQQADLQRRADRALQTISHELTGAGIHTLAPDPTSNFGSDTLTFQTPRSVSGTGVVTWNAPSTITLQMGNGEADNGLDDNHNGLTDERQLVITRGVGTANPRTTVICTGVAEQLQGELSNGIDDNGNGIVDEHGFCVRRVGSLLYLYLTVEKAAERGRVTQWTTSTAIVLHN